MSLKLTLGKLRDAWLDYPDARRAYLAMPPGPPIFVAGTHRSGTTWFASMLAIPGIWYIHEPFNPNKQLWNVPFSYASPESTVPDVDRYLSRLLAGKHRKTAAVVHTEHWLMPLRLFCPPIRRVLIKDPLACLLNGYIARRFDVRMHVLFRHPAGFVASLSRLGWPVGTFLRQFLNTPPLMKEHLAPFAKLMELHCNDDSVSSAAVLHGVLNQVQWNQINSNRSILWHRFEDLCENPIQHFQSIFRQLDIPYLEAARQLHLQLCMHGSPDPSRYHTHAVARNSKAMAHSWRRQISTDDKNRIRDIWMKFEVPLYRTEADWDNSPPDMDTSPDFAPPTR